MHGLGDEGAIDLFIKHYGCVLVLKGMMRLKMHFMVLIIVFVLIGSVSVVSADGGNMVVLYDVLLRDDSTSEFLGSGATVQVYIKNQLANSVRVEDIKLLDRSVSYLVEQGSDVVWFDVNPNVIMPGQIGLVKVRLRRTMDVLKFKTMEVVFNDNNRTWSQTYSLPGLDDRSSVFLSYVAFSESLDRIYIYIRNREKGISLSRITKIEWEGEDVTHLVEKTFVLDELLFAKVTLLKELREGAYGTLRVTLDDDTRAIYQVRVLKPHFPVGMYGRWGSSLYDEYKAHNVGAYFSMHSLPSSEYLWMNRIGNIFG